MAKIELTYQEALAEIELILSKMQESERDIDQLEKDVKRASELIAFCKEKLKTTEDKLNKILEEESE
ncbi:MAG: exodeoxyribonuclease VII small subunit [Prevotellaceae bacterium]|jgi:exodeoxyribonuclease VII small subunit|nr:exodeoxyribonuclease VII small subunit [Prevotellaceae bacterium]